MPANNACFLPVSILPSRGLSGLSSLSINGNKLVYLYLTVSQSVKARGAPLLPEGVFDKTTLGQLISWLQTVQAVVEKGLLCHVPVMTSQLIFTCQRAQQLLWHSTR